MRRYLEKMLIMLQSFDKVEVEHILKNENLRADTLYKLASSASLQLGRTMFIKYLKIPSVRAEDHGDRLLPEAVFDGPHHRFSKREKATQGGN